MAYFLIILPRGNMYNENRKGQILVVFHTLDLGQILVVLHTLLLIIYENLHRYLVFCFFFTCKDLNTTSVGHSGHFSLTR